MSHETQQGTNDPLPIAPGSSESGRAVSEVLVGGGEMGALMRSIDWARTPVGPVEAWPSSLKTLLGLLLSSASQLCVLWGPELVQFYNDGFRPILGSTKHPRALGQRARECWSEVWSVIEPMYAKVLAGGSTSIRDGLLVLDRHGFLEECYFDYTYSPLRDDASKIAGILAICAEVTDRVLGERRLRALGQLGAGSLDTKSPELACGAAATVLAGVPADVPFALLYLLDENSTHARLAGCVGVEPGHPAAPPLIRIGEEAATWPLHEAFTAERDLLLAPLPFASALPGGPWPEPPERAVLLPLKRGGEALPHGFLVAGISPRLALDAPYREFLRLIANQLAAAIQQALSFEQEKRRALELMQLDRAKTAFFSNVSHELRTPLTLILGPVEDGLADAQQPLPPEQRERQELVRRNALRLRKLVNTLLDFARIEAGRAQVAFVPTDLSALTRDLASSFDSAMATAGLKLRVDCAPLPQPVYVDPAMWEKVVLNLLSNAFKFTFEGEVRVALKWLGESVELRVQDTGTGIPAEELPRIFERFHRVEGTRGRSHEGSGIGLALVQELVRLHGGKVEVESTPGRGTTFTVRLPTGSAHLPQERLGAAPTLTSAAAGSSAFLEEASQWNDAARTAATPSTVPTPALHTDVRILVADDNADMRHYFTRLLSPHWTVETVSDGAQALAAAQVNPPDLVLSDVMMPGMNGLELVRGLRADERTRTIPVMLLSARAGEEAIIEGLTSGANEYLVKPFSANELLARVNAQLAVSHLRQEVLRAERAHAKEAQRLLAEAERATRSREETLAIVSHDLRSPLASISTAAELLQRSLGDDPRESRRRKHADSIRRAVIRMDRLVGDLLDLASIDSGSLSLQPRLHAAEELLQELKEVFEAQAVEHGIALETEVASDVPPLPLDKERILQALGNLVSNALKFTPHGGSVRVRAKHEPGAGEVLFSVTDTGPGVPPEAQPHIFDRYWHAAQKKREGHGLGLSIAKGIVESHGGRIRVESSPGAGATFSFSLPLEQKAGTVLPLARPTPRPMAPAMMRPGLEESFIQGGGEMGALMRSIDWSKSVLGPIAQWPQSLRTSVSTMLRSPYPIILFWGPEKTMLYNDPFRPILGAKHPETMGARGHEALAEEWTLLGPLMQRVMDTGEPLFIQDGNVNFARRAGGLREEAYFTWSYNPTIGETGEIAGLVAISSETTRQVVGDRQMGALRELSIRTSLNKKVEEIFVSLEEVLARAGHDVPFALLYVVKADKAQLVACTGLTRGAPAAPNAPPLGDTASWPLEQVVSAGKEVLVEDLHSKFGPLPGGPWPEPATRALLLPVPMGGDAETTGVLVAGLSPLRALDEEYRGFLQLLARQLAASISSARAYEQERQRSEELAQLDRAKTAFFSNVSHEFRTPLTLMLGPLEDALSDASAPLPPPQRERLALVMRNANRLFKLVNTLLDYSRLEAGRAKATFQPMDLAALTAQLANHFESAVRRAGLSLTVECPPLPEPVWVDVESWEKIVFNLLSNALKHTFSGGVTVSLRHEAEEVRLEVRDTGTGIPPEELPHIFERFHRVEGAQSRSHEGSGIGLALVKELVGLHHGRVDAESDVGRGTVFTVSVPLGHSHLPADRTAAGPRATGAEPERAAPYLEETLGWLPREDAPDAPPASLPAAQGEPETAHRLGRVLVADDNADLREYLSRTLSPLFEVELVADGQAALDAVQERVPDVVVTDVMMPRLSGFGLLRALRASPQTQAVPVVMLSARAGEESAVEGMDAGADDYLAKPFSARELVARVRAALELSRMRRDIARQEALAEGLREALRARDAFLSVAGHELKTPLASFRLQLELLERGLNPEMHSKLVDRLGVASRQLGHLSALVEGLLTVSELAAGRLELKPGEVDLSVVVEDVATGMKAELARAGCATALDVERGVVAPCDGTRIGQVLASLVRYVLRSGQGCPLEVSLRKEGAAARLSVTGHGSSMSPEDRERVFGDFERAVPTQHYGSGLEVWVARQVVEAHAGVFEVTDTAGGGTTFHILLPLLALPRREVVSSA